MNLPPTHQNIVISTHSCYTRQLRGKLCAIVLETMENKLNHKKCCMMLMRCAMIETFLPDQLHEDIQAYVFLFDA